MDHKIKLINHLLVHGMDFLSMFKLLYTKEIKFVNNVVIPKNLGHDAKDIQNETKEPKR